MTAQNNDHMELIRGKFAEFVNGLVGLQKIKDTLYEPLQEKVSNSLDTMVTTGEYPLRELTGLITFDPEDKLKVLSTDIRIPEGEFWDSATMVKVLTSMTDQLKACKVPEPEVLISVKGLNRLTYKLSREWINWHGNIFPEYREHGGANAAAWHATRKHFKRGPADQISFEISPLAERQLEGDVEVKFFRVTREEL